MKVVEMRPVSEELDGKPATHEEKDTAIAGVYKELAGGEPGDYAVFVGGNLLVYGTIVSNGEIVLYQTRVERVSTNIDDEFKPAAEPKLTGAGGARG